MAIDTSAFRQFPGARNRGAADIFGVFCPETEGVYLVPVDAVGSTEIHLRVTPARSNRVAGINLASDYILLRPVSTVVSAAPR